MFQIKEPFSFFELIIKLTFNHAYLSKGESKAKSKIKHQSDVRVYLVCTATYSKVS